ncbi:CopM family metallochaperone [Ensifer adhaerens]|uniref:CopM family metallochaperone n=1 Tax=Ensifer adhaerens TaxID=106592 RepID=UPI003F85A44E
MNIVLKFAVAAAAVSISFSVSIAPAAAQMTIPDGCKSEMHAAGDMKMAEMGQMADHQKAMMESMQKMHPAMMQGMMAKDPDVAFVCGMIGHHMGAISMSEVELKYGDDEQAKTMAKNIIDAQKKEIEEMTKWVNEHAK